MSRCILQMILPVFEGNIEKVRQKMATSASFLPSMIMSCENNICETYHLYKASVLFW